MAFRTIDPSTGLELRSYASLSDVELEEAVAGADRRARDWAGAGFEQRAVALLRAASLLRAGEADLARLMAAEMGKPLPEGRAEVEKCALVCEHYAEHGEAYLRAEPAPPAAMAAAGGTGMKEYVAYRPLGVVLAIMPWNFPLWQVFRFAAPNLMAGNGALLKHAENVLGCAEAIEALWLEAGLPAGLFRQVPIEVERVDGLLRDPRVRAATLTGSTRAGRAVASGAGAVLKKTVLELGGSDPYVVLADADVELAARTCVTARMLNAGQTCIAAKRLVVVDAVREEFEERVIQLMGERRMGPPLGPPSASPGGPEEVDLGPLARADLCETLHSQVETSVAAGARAVLGGAPAEGPGNFYPPTVLLDVRPGMPAFDEETFGPVAAVVPAADEAEALRLANQTPYGLGAAVFTRDLERGERIAREGLDAGACAVNDFVRSDPRLPFGGVKASGYGRELGAPGIREFTNVKTVVVVER